MNIPNLSQGITSDNKTQSTKVNYKHVLSQVNDFTAIESLRNSGASWNREPRDDSPSPATLSESLAVFAEEARVSLYLGLSR